MTSTAPPSLHRLEVPAEDRYLSEVRDFVTQAGARFGFTGRALANIRLAVDEACTNAVKHAYADSAGTLRLHIAARRGWLEIRVADQGRPFDGRVEIPHLGQWIDSRRKGGFGVFLMHRLMDEVRYETTPAGNEWILRKRLPRPSSELGRRLRRRYALRAAAAIVIGSAVVAVPLTVHEGRQRVREEERSLLARANALAAAAGPALLEHRELSREQTRLFEAVHALAAQEPRLLAVTVVDREHMVWASDRPAATFTRFLEPAGLGSPDAQGIRRALERVEGELVLYVAVPVEGGGATDLGAVHLTFRWGTTAAAIRAARLRIAAVTLALDALAVLLVVAFLAHLLGPLQRLVDGVRALGQGGSEVAVEGPEEIGAIAAAFNEIHSRYRVAQQDAAAHARLQEEMQLAREIQASILPHSVPEIPGFEIARVYRPAQEVGGDYYDFLDAGPGLTGVVVADVAGKGVPGSLVMSMVRTALRMETRSNANASDVLARLHAFVAPDLRRGMFVTMLYLVLDSRNRVVSYASAGHTPMLFYRARNEEALELAPRGMPVGLAGSDEQTFEKALDVERLRLQAGDLLLLYTDGITEARNASGDEYGQERLLEKLRRWGKESAADFLKRLEADLLEFTGSRSLADDLTLVAIKEKQDAARVPGEVQQKLFDLVEREGIPVLEACARLQVSPATYYRLRHASAEAEPPTRANTPPAQAPAGDPPSAPARRDEAPAVAALDSRPEAPPPGGLSGSIEWPATPPDCAVVRLAGALDSGACGALEQVLARARSNAARLVVDVSGVAYISSRGWGLLAATCAALRPAGDLVLCGLGGATRDVFRMLGFEHVLRAYADAGTALAALSSGAAEDAAPAPTPGSMPVPVPAPAPLPVPVPVPVSVSVSPGLELVEEWESLRVRAGRVGAGGEVTVVALAGILDTTCAARLGRVFDTLVAGGARRLLVDLACLEFASSAGWGCFTAPIVELRDAGGDLRLFGMSSRLARIYDLLHLRSVLQSFDLLADALASFGIAPSVDEPGSGVSDTTSSSAAGTVPEHSSGVADTVAEPVPGVADVVPEPSSGVASAALEPGPEAAHQSPSPGSRAADGSPDAGCGVDESDRDPRASWIEPFGRSGQAFWLRPRADEPGAVLGAPLPARLASLAGAVLFVDARGACELDPSFWSALARHAEEAGHAGGAVYVIGPEPRVEHAGALGLSVHVSEVEALRARQGKRPAPLGHAQRPDLELHRDAEVRLEGWNTYVALLRECAGEETA